jgi:5,10-methylenetetrahydromethanopterin reductase
MKFGVRLIEYLGTSTELLELAVLAERAGVDSVWFPHDPFMRNTWVMTSAAATLTKRVQLGGVAINPYTTDPSEIATYAATLDELSGGRCILGLGLHTDLMVAWTGRDTGAYLDVHREAVALVRRLLRGEVAANAGNPYFPWTDQCYLRFKPLRPDIPIYLSSFGDDFHEMAGEIADGCQPMVTPPAGARRTVAAIERGIARSGRARDRFTISGCGWLSLAEDGALAAAKMRGMISYFGPYLEEEALQTVGLSKRDFAAIKKCIDNGDYGGAQALVTDDMLKLAVVGTPEQVVRQIEALAEAGIDEIGFGGPLGPDPAAAIELLGRKVIPHFR